MKLLLDAMYPPVIAEQLRKRGHDVRAAQEDPALRSVSDPQLFAAAQADARVVVTENAPDFMELHLAYQRSGEPHHGLVYTSDAKFPRHQPGTVGALVRALAALLKKPPPRQPPRGWLHWL